MGKKDVLFTAIIIYCLQPYSLKKKSLAKCPNFWEKKNIRYLK